LRILIVDDEIPIREWIAYTINNLNINCEIVGLAANGAEAFRLFESGYPDLVFTDIKMPVMDGIELLKLIRQSGRKCYVVILTTYDDFNYARQALSLNADEYILKTEINDSVILEIFERCKAKSCTLTQSESLEEVLRKNAFINEIVNNNISDTNAIKELINEQHIDLEDGYIAVISFYLENCRLDRKFREALSYGENDIIRKCIFFIYNNDILLIVANLAQVPSQSKQIEALREFAGKLENVVNGCISVSPVYLGLANLRRAANESISGLKLSFYNSSRSTVYMNLSDETDKQKSEIEGFLDKILLLIEKKKAEESLNEIRQLSKIISGYEFRDIDYIKKLYLKILNQYALKYTAGDSKKIIDLIHHAQSEFNNVKSFDELVTAVEHRIRDIIWSNNASLDNYSEYIKQAIIYTNEHYQTIEKVSEVSKMLNLNTEYFCRLFKREVGMTYVTYLTNIRMEKAMHLIKYSNIKICEIARLVGYNNISYFSKLFKRTYGKNPFKIRNE